MESGRTISKEHCDCSWSSICTLHWERNRRTSRRGRRRRSSTVLKVSEGRNREEEAQLCTVCRISQRRDFGWQKGHSWTSSTTQRGIKKRRIGRKKERKSSSKVLLFLLFFFFKDIFLLLSTSFSSSSSLFYSFILSSWICVAIVLPFFCPYVNRQMDFLNLFCCLFLLIDSCCVLGHWRKVNQRDLRVTHKQLEKVSPISSNTTLHLSEKKSNVTIQLFPFVVFSYFPFCSKWSREEEC